MPCVALNGVEDRRPVGIEDPLQLQDRVVYGGLEVAVLRIYHQPHICLRQQLTHLMTSQHFLHVMQSLE